MRLRNEEAPLAASEVEAAAAEVKAPPLLTAPEAASELFEAPPKF